MTPTKALVAMEGWTLGCPGVLPDEGIVHIVGVVEGLDASGCSSGDAGGHAGGGLQQLLGQGSDLIDGAVKQRPDRPVVVLYTGARTASSARVEAGADDIVSLPSREHAVCLEKVARVGGQTGTVSQRPLICGWDPKARARRSPPATWPFRDGPGSDRSRLFGDVSLRWLAPDRTIYDWPSRAAAWTG
jgi:hypothetical protein